MKTLNEIMYAIYVNRKDRVLLGLILLGMNLCLSIPVDQNQCGRETWSVRPVTG